MLNLGTTQGGCQVAGLKYKAFLQSASNQPGEWNYSSRLVRALIPRRALALALALTSLAPFTVSCSGLTTSHTILVRVQGTPGIPYQVKLNASQDTDFKGGNGDGEFTFETTECLVSVEVDSTEFDTIYVGLWINGEFDDRDMSETGYVILSGSCL